MKRPLNSNEEQQHLYSKFQILKQAESETSFSSLCEDMVFEIFKHVDSQTLARASCVNKKLEKISKDERLWEIMCTHHWVDTGCSKEQLRPVVLAFGGFRLLHSLYIRPILKASTKSNQFVSSTPKLGKDEFQLSLSLLSIWYYERMGSSFKHIKNPNCNV